MGLKVLVADDATFVRDTIKRTLRQFIPEVELYDAVDGRRAISALKINRIDLILSDWEMPEMTGEELLRWVREQDHYKNTPFIMVTSRGDRDNVVKAVHGGVSDFMTKPFTADELRRKVMKQLKKIGYIAPKRAQSKDASMGSLEALTGGKPAAVEVGSASSVANPLGMFSKPAAAKRSAPKKAANFEGRAQLRFPDATCECVIRELSLQAMSGFMIRPATMPRLFEQAVVDMEDKKGVALGRLNAYVHSMQALEANPETQKIKISIRFVDNDPEKFELLSKLIAGG